MLSQVMASGGTNWKRPWQEDQRYQTTRLDGPAPSQTVLGDSQASPLHSQIEGQPRQAPAAPHLSQSLPASQEPQQIPPMQGGSELLNGSGDKYPSTRSSPTSSSKRPRLGASPVNDRRYEPDAGSRSFSQHPPHRPTRQAGYLEPRISDSSPREDMSVRQGFMSLVGPSPFEPIPSAAQRPHDMSHLTENRSLIREDITRPCDVCDRAKTLAPELANGLQRLHKDLRHIHERSKGGPTLENVPSPESVNQSTPDKIVETLDFCIGKLNDNMKIAKDMLNSLILDDHSSRGGIAQQRYHAENHQAGWEQGEALSAGSAHPSLHSADENSRAQEYRGRGGRDDRNQNEVIHHLQSGLHGHQGLGQQSSPSRVLPTLPSPPGIKFTTSAGILPPMSPSVLGPNGQSPHVAHLQDLQHQLSTKSLAHQILQGEHEKLLAAYSRSQTRCASLDKKSQVSDTEISNLTEDRLRLQSQIEILEQQVEELQQSRDEAHKQSVANGSQYMQIMSMSSRLQAQSAVDLKKWKTDRDAWSAEKDELLLRITGLEKSAGNIMKHNNNGTRASTSEGPSESEEAELSGMSFEKLKEEILSLRRGKREADSLLQAYKEEGSVIYKLTEELHSAGERLTKMGAIDTVQVG